jgi:hypothetical protein
VVLGLAILSPVQASDAGVVARTGVCRLTTPRRNAGLQHLLHDTCEHTARRIYAQLGAAFPSSSGAIDVRIVEDPEQLHEKAPAGLRLPEWTGAVAFPEHGLILLPLYRMDGSVHSDMDVTLAHELSHMAFRQASGGARVPRWFSEGVAILQSEGSSMERRGAIWWASMVNDISSLRDIERYPEGGANAARAYAQAAEFTSFLVEQYGWAGIRRILYQVRTVPFEVAFRNACGVSVEHLEARWRRRLFAGSSWLRELTGDTVVLGLAALLCIMGFRIVRRRHRRRLSEMEAEERAMDRLISAIEERSADGEKPPRDRDLLN